MRAGRTGSETVVAGMNFLGARLAGRLAPSSEVRAGRTGSETVVAGMNFLGARLAGRLAPSSEVRAGRTGSETVVDGMNRGTKSWSRWRLRLPKERALRPLVME